MLDTVKSKDYVVTDIDDNTRLITFLNAKAEVHKGELLRDVYFGNARSIICDGFVYYRDTDLRFVKFTTDARSGYIIKDSHQLIHPKSSTIGKANDVIKTYALKAAY